MKEKDLPKYWILSTLHSCYIHKETITKDGLCYRFQDVMNNQTCTENIELLIKEGSIKEIPDGKVFITKIGIRKYKRAEEFIRKENRTDWAKVAIIIGGLSSGVYYIFDLLKSVMKIFFCHHC